VKWNLEVQQSLGDKTAVSINYVGNIGYDLFLQNRTLNAYCTAAKCPNGFEDLSTSPKDTRFSNIREYANGGKANYEGLTLTATRRMTKGFTGSVNYTWSHTLDDLYEGGIEPLNALANPSFSVAIDPFNQQKYNYSNADQDVRHLLTANYYWEFPFRANNAILNQAISGWAWSSTWIYTSGTPFSVYYTSVTSSLLSNASNGRALAIMTTPGTGNCGKPSTTSPCLTKSQFVHTISTPQTTWGGGGNNRRNNFRGPGYFDSDMALSKNFRLTEKGLVLSFGAEAYNFLNHPNFDRPTGSLSSGLFGTIWETVGQPNSPYGNFQGAAVNGRIIQSTLKVKF
jgi:hypothetical protein